MRQPVRRLCMAPLRITSYALFLAAVLAYAAFILLRAAAHRALRKARPAS